MPITVKQAIPGVLGRLAVRAGEARGREIQMGRDIQLTSLALAAQDRAAQIGMAARDRSFALQRAGAAQIARQRPVTPDTRAQQQKLRKFVSEAEATGVYDPRQLKQAQIFADIGDAGAVRSILGELPRLPKEAKAPALTAGQKELMRQSKALAAMTELDISSRQQQIVKIDKLFGKQATPEYMEFLEKNPDSAPPELQEEILKRRELSAQVGEIQQQASQAQRKLLEGFTLPKQAALDIQRGEKKRQAIEKGQRIRRAAVERIERRNQRQLERQIAVEQRKLKIDPYVAPAGENARAKKAAKKITELEKKLQESYDREDAALGGSIIPKQPQTTVEQDEAAANLLILNMKGDIQQARRIAGLPESGGE